MQFFIVVLLICLFIFLYCVYVLSNDDFIFLRRDVSMERIFNIIFIGSLISFFAARIFYGFSQTSIFLNPLLFILFPYFPGLSLLGGVIGGGMYLLFLKTRKENSLPMARISDFFSIAFLISLPIGYIGFLMFSENTMMIKSGLQAAAYLIAFIIFLKFSLPKLLNGMFKEGTIAFQFLVLFSIISLISNAFPKIILLNYLKNFENIILILILLLSIGVLVKLKGGKQ